MKHVIWHRVGIKATPAAANAMVKRIWSAPGHQQFGEMIGQGDANARGDMASPGFGWSRH